MVLSPDVYLVGNVITIFMESAELLSHWSIVFPTHYSKVFQHCLFHICHHVALLHEVYSELFEGLQ